MITSVYMASYPVCPEHFCKIWGNVFIQIIAKSTKILIMIIIIVIIIIIKR